MTKPNWQKAKDYNYTNDYSENYSAWAWEFLRRGNDYRSAYEVYLKEASDLGLELEFGVDWKNIPEARVYDPPLLENETWEKWVQRCELELDKRTRRIHLHKLRGETFYLDGMFDPGIPYHEGIAFLSPLRFPYIAKKLDDLDPFIEEFDVYDSITGEPTDGVITSFNQAVGVVVFALDSNLEKQLTAAKKGLVKLQKTKHLKKPHLPTPYPVWRSYLQVLDAKLDGESTDEIASVFWPEPGPDEDPISKVTERVKQARRWTRPGHYRRLLMRQFAEK